MGLGFVPSRPAACAMSDPQAVVYLCGAIDLAPDKGVHWREQVGHCLRSHGCVVADPARMQEQVIHLRVEELMALRGLDEARFIAETRRLMMFDLEFVAQKATCLIAVVDEHARMGTFAELGVAYLSGVPVLLVCQDRALLSGWTLSCAEQVFESIPELLDWLEAQAAADPPLSRALSKRRSVTPSP